jgi:choline dehydrogenase-like flavoprotein
MPMALGRDWTLKSGGTPFNSFTDIIRRLDDRPDFRLLLQSHALRIEHDEGGRASRVIYHDQAQGVERAIDCKAVVLAAGALASTKLLLDSSSHTFPHGLGNTNGLLGTHLHDHPLQMCIIEMGRSMPRLAHPAYLTRAPYEESEPLLAAGCLLGARISQIDRLLTLTPARTRVFGVNIFGTMVPSCEGRVALNSKAKDRFGLPQLEIAIGYGPDVTANLERARERLLLVLDSAGLQPSVRALYPVFQPGASVHFGGTIRMHASPEYGVSNGWGRLHDVPNLMVADSSVFTTSVEKNPVLTAMALAARGATRLADDLKCGAA